MGARRDQKETIKMKNKYQGSWEGQKEAAGSGYSEIGDIE